jgi:hypothetical protein
VNRENPFFLQSIIPLAPELYIAIDILNDCPQNKALEKLLFPAAY